MTKICDCFLHFVLWLFICCRRHIQLAMPHHVLTALRGSLVHQSTLLPFPVLMELTPLDYKFPVLTALQAWPAHQQQQPRQLQMFVQLVPTVSEDKTSVLHALRGMPVHQYVLMMLFYVEKAPMHSVVQLCVMYAQLGPIVLILPLLLFHALRDTTV